MRGLVAGRLRELVTIERRVPGDAADTGQLIGTAWAEILPLTGYETFRAGETEAVVTHRITMRGSMDVRPTDRLVHGSRVFQVRSVRNIEERGRLLELDASEAIDG